MFIYSSSSRGFITLTFFVALAKLTGSKWLNVSDELASLRGRGYVSEEMAVTSPLSFRSGVMKKLTIK